jgi:16S rRNA pseudouridine516 synthase
MSARRSRLDRLVARLLGISPDDVRLLLAQQRIRVDGRVADSREEMIDGFARVEVDERVLQQQQRVCVMLHKPAGVLSATRDPRHTVATSLIDHTDVETLHIAGRLDLHASGLLLLTNDGRWSRAISDPECGVSKQYLVRLRDALHEDYVTAFAQGMHFPFEDIVTRPALLEILEPHLARVTLQEGRYHQLKRMFGRFRNPVLGIHRCAIGALQLPDDLPPGAWRLLDAQAQDLVLARAAPQD